MTQEEKIIAKFKRQIGALNKTIKEAREIWPDANYYLSCNAMNLCKSEPHTGKGESHYDSILTTVILNYSDGGDW